MSSSRITTLEERVEAVEYFLSSGENYAETIEKYQISSNQIRNWVKKYRASGVSGLEDRRGKAKPEAGMTELDRLKLQLKLKEAENRRLRVENGLLKKLKEPERGMSKH